MGTGTTVAGSGAGAGAGAVVEQLLRGLHALLRAAPAFELELELEPRAHAQQPQCASEREHECESASASAATAAVAVAVRERMHGVLKHLVQASAAHEHKAAFKQMYRAALLGSKRPLGVLLAELCALLPAGRR